MKNINYIKSFKRLILVFFLFSFFLPAVGSFIGFRVFACGFFLLFSFPQVLFTAIFGGSDYNSIPQILDLIILLFVMLCWLSNLIPLFSFKLENKKRLFYFSLISFISVPVTTYHLYKNGIQAWGGTEYGLYLGHWIWSISIILFSIISCIEFFLQKDISQITQTDINIK